MAGGWMDGWMAFCLLNARLWIVCVRRGSETCVEISRRRRRIRRGGLSKLGGTSLDAGDARRRSPLPTNGRLRAPNLPQCGGGQRASDPPTPTCLTTSREHRLCQDRPGSTDSSRETSRLGFVSRGLRDCQHLDSRPPTTTVL